MKDVEAKENNLAKGKLLPVTFGRHKATNRDRVLAVPSTKSDDIRRDWHCVGIGFRKPIGRIHWQVPELKFFALFAGKSGVNGNRISVVGIVRFANKFDRKFLPWLTCVCQFQNKCVDFINSALDTTKFDPSVQIAPIDPIARRIVTWEVDGRPMLFTSGLILGVCEKHSGICRNFGRILLHPFGPSFPSNGDQDNEDGKHNNEINCQSHSIFQTITNSVDFLLKRPIYNKLELRRGSPENLVAGTL